MNDRKFRVVLKKEHEPVAVRTFHSKEKAREFVDTRVNYDELSVTENGEPISVDDLYE